MTSASKSFPVSPDSITIDQRKTHLLIAIVASVAIAVMALFARVPTYHAAPIFLLPVVWGIYFLRDRLHLHPIHFALLASAILLHMLGAFGFYQKSPLPFSFDILVHYYFAVALTPAIYTALAGNLPLPRWQIGVATLMCMMGLGALHEIMEYGSYLVLGKEKGMLKPDTSYFFDTQRDLLNNLLGALTALSAIAFRNFRHRSS